MRVPIGPRQFVTPPAEIVLVFSGFAMLGISLVLLLRSPFRMSPAPRVATVPPSSSASAMLADPLRTLDARVRELERWRREQDA